MRLLVYGAGVIGSLYARLFSEAGFNVTIYARGNRLAELNEKGLIYEDKNGNKTIRISVIDKIDDNDYYDYIFLTVRSEQAEAALNKLIINISPSIVTMINTSKEYSYWEEIAGKGRILPAFPGAGGSIDGGILHAKLTPSIIQPTTFGEIDGIIRNRTIQLKKIFKKSKIPFQVIKNMHYWQISHLGLVVPIADAYYLAKDARTVFKEKDIMMQTAVSFRRNFKILSNKRMLSPFKFHLIKICPTFLLKIGLSFVFNSDFGNVFMYRHSMKSSEEMRRLHDEFYSFIDMLCS